CRSRPAPVRGKAEVGGTVRANKFHQTCRGIGDGMQAKGTIRNTRSPSGDHGFGSTGNSREIGRAVWDGGEARCTDEAG
ncbi:MAG TPA: hypothetical protein VNO32_65780, partial [Candidatus Acidoferrum sp.]|nr:hypothetical protein [Candidatus Acidoferrum sp.]